MKRIDKVVFAGLGAVGSAFFAKVCDNISPEAARAVAYGERAHRYEEEGLTHNGKNTRSRLLGRTTRRRSCFYSRQEHSAR